MDGEQSFGFSESKESDVLQCDLTETHSTDIDMLQCAGVAQKVSESFSKLLLLLAWHALVRHRVPRQI